MDYKQILFRFYVKLAIVLANDVRFNKTLTSSISMIKRMHDISGKVTHHCFNKQVTIAIGNGNTTSLDFFISFFNDLTPVHSFTSHDGDVFERYKRIKKFYRLTEEHLRRKNNPAANVVIFISTSNNFRVILKKLRDSIWWNHNARFLIVDTNLNDRCQFTTDLLKTFWEFNVLSVIYLCYIESKLVLYTFNPYGHSAPEFWRISKNNATLTYQYWTLLERNDQLPLIINSSSCSVLFFDKIINLNGNRVKGVVFKAAKRFQFERVNLCESRSLIIEYRIICLLLNHINATLTVKYSNEPAHIDEKGEAHGAAKDVLTGVADITLKMFFLRDYWKAQLYPFDAGVLKIVTAKQKVKMTEKILSIFNIQVLIFLISNCIFFVLAMRYFLDEPITLGIFEIVRIFIGAPMLKKPRLTWKRIAFILLIIYVSGFNSYLQSVWKALRTVPDNNCGIKNIDDLIQSDLSIYGYGSHKELVPSLVLRQRYQTIVQIEDCIDRVFYKDRPGVCILSLSSLIVSPQLHVLEENVAERSSTYTCSEDSPFLMRFSKFLLRISEVGILLAIKSLSKNSKDGNVYTSEEQVGDNENLVLGQIVLCTGWTLAILVLLSEILLFKYKNGFINRLNAEL